MQFYCTISLFQAATDSSPPFLPNRTYSAISPILPSNLYHLTFNSATTILTNSPHLAPKISTHTASSCIATNFLLQSSHLDTIIGIHLPHVPGRALQLLLVFKLSHHAFFYFPSHTLFLTSQPPLPLIQLCLSFWPFLQFVHFPLICQSSHIPRY